MQEGVENVPDSRPRVRNWGGDGVQEGVDVIGNFYFWNQQEDEQTS